MLDIVTYFVTDKKNELLITQEGMNKVTRAVALFHLQQRDDIPNKKEIENLFSSRDSFFRE